MDVFWTYVAFLTLFYTCHGVPVVDKSQAAENCPKKDEYAVCNLMANRNIPNAIYGTIYFYQRMNPDCTYDFLSVQVNINNLPIYDKTEKHGFHVHEYGDMTGGCESMGGHYNPHGAPHGYGWNSPSARHVGDLGNVVQKPNSGKINTRVVDYLACIYGPESIIGRGIVLHAGEDDLGMKNDTGSMTTGNAGPRLACCVIAKSQPFSIDHFTLYRR